MSTRNRARKSTGPRGAQRPSTSANNTSNGPNQRKRRPTNANFSLQSIPSSSSESEAATQPLNIRNRYSSPGPSGINRLRIVSSSDSDPDGPAQRPTRAQNTRIVQRQESTSSGPTTSDSDEVPGRESMGKGNANAKIKRKRKSKQVPKRKKITRKPSSSSEADEPPKTSSSTFPTKRQSLPQARNISSLVNKCVYFLLIADQKKHAIKKTEILKHVFHNQDKKMYGAVIEEANNVLKQTYGMEILTSEKRKGEYILINILNRDLGIQDFVELSPLDLQKRGLVFYLLTVIFMNEKSISENELWEALKPLGIDATSKLPHPIFGDVRKYLTNELVKQMYLEHKCISKDPPEFEFTWGERAKQEIDKKDILDFACKILGDTQPKDWILQYNDAMDIGDQDE